MKSTMFLFIYILFIYFCEKRDVVQKKYKNVDVKEGHPMRELMFCFVNEGK